MKPQKPYIDYTYSTIVTEKEILPVKRIDMVFTQQTFEEFIQNEKLTIFLCTDRSEKFGFLYCIDKDYLMEERIFEGVYPSGKKWEVSFCYMKNLAFDDEFCLDDFPNGCCILPELWQSDNEDFLVLYYFH